MIFRMREKTTETGHVRILDDRVSGIMDAKEGNKWKKGVMQGAPLLIVRISGDQ